MYFSLSLLQASGTALLAAAAYRLSSLDPSFSTWIPQAERAYKNISTYLASDAGSSGWLAPVVNPLGKSHF